MNKVFLLFLILVAAIISCKRIISGSDAEINEISIKTKIDSLIISGSTNLNNSADSSLSILKTAEKKAADIGYMTGVANSLFNQAKILYNKNLYTEARIKFEKSKEIAVKLNNKLLEADCLERLASINLATTDPNLALKLYYESLSIYESLDNEKGKAKIYNILGIFQLNKKNYALAEDYEYKSLKIHQKLKDTNNIAENYGNLGYIFQKKGDVKAAEEIYVNLIKILKSGNDKVSLAVIYYNYASLLQSEKEIDKAIENLNQAIFISEQSNDTSLLSTLYGNTGEIYLDKGEFNKALFYLKKAYSYATIIKDYETELQAQNFLITIYLKQGNTKDLIEAYKNANILKDSIFNQKIRNHSQASELKYQNEINKNIILKQNLNINLKKNENILLTVTIVLLLLLIIISLIFYKKRLKYLNQNLEIKNNRIQMHEWELKNKENTEEINRLNHEKALFEIREKEKDLKNIALHNEYRIDLINSILNKITDIKNIDSNQIKEELISLEKTIRSKINESGNQDLFNDYFNQIHADFFNNLKNEHSELTLNELKFCAYLRIQLSSNQIAGILNITIEAIRKTRYRIRKKLKLNPEVSLEEYLEKY
jgi:tetratricopeptide (TPR) repeat protein